MNYWLVGAMFGGSEAQYEIFLRCGYWYCWEPGQPGIPPAAHNRFQRISVGDRIAIKKLLGQGSSAIEIRALGVVTDIDLEEWRVYVAWYVTGLERRVPLHGCAGSIHGPFDYSEEWTRQVFCL